MMKSRMYSFLLGLILTPLLLASCDGGQAIDSEMASVAADDTVRKAQQLKEQPPKEQPQEFLTVFKSPTCGCCGEWVTHIESEGFTAAVRNSPDVAAIKEQHGIGAGYRSCHTAVSNSGYVFEGHVPAKYIRQFLADTPDGAIGLAVPGMPVGSPGMEVEDKFEPYQVVLLKKDGTADVYATVSSREQQYQ